MAEVMRMFASLHAVEVVTATLALLQYGPYCCGVTTDGALNAIRQLRAMKGH
jgi:hypothetical protein